VSRGVQRRYLAALAIGVVAAVGAGYAVIGRGGPATSKPAAGPAGVLPPRGSPRPAVLGPLASDAAAPTTVALDAALARYARPQAIGGRLAGLVTDPASGATLWSRGGTVPSPPASTTKLLTAAAALRTLGPDYRFDTVARLRGHVIYLVGGGDPTLLRTEASPALPPYPRPATLAALARRTASALPDSGRYRVRFDAGGWSGPRLAAGWSKQYLDEGDVTVPSALEVDEGRLHPADLDSERSPTPAAQAGVAFAALLRRRGVDVRGAVGPARAPAGAEQVAQVRSPPLTQLVERMLTVSDNDLAEALGRSVAAAVGLPATFVGAAAAVTKQLAGLGVPNGLVLLHDTSGLSHLDRIAPAALVDVLRAAVSPARPVLRPIVEGLPVAGFSGTLTDRFRRGAALSAAGTLRAKTGTLRGVNALAGTLVDRSGRLLVFALLVSKASDPARTLAALDRLVARLARCGCSAAG
jgi:D-alanyl-D-alanine carboxypeptidase/D-alanyl-D-alanine-endopeptidase (penicillin-binding protein 4)